MPSGGPKGENCLVDMDSKAGDPFAAEEAQPTGTGGAGVMAKYELNMFLIWFIVHQVPQRESADSQFSFECRDKT